MRHDIIISPELGARMVIKRKTQEDGTQFKVIRLPRLLHEKLLETTFYLKRSNPAALWSQNKVVCEALRSWLQAADEKLREKGIMK